MKRIVSLGLIVGGLAGLFWVYSLAQTAGPQYAVSKLERAKALLHIGKPDEARAVLATITVGEPDFEHAKFYEAFARSEANDRLGFLNALEKLAPQSNNIPSELEMELTVRQIEALSFYRKFEELLPKALAFQEQHADSPDAPAMREHLLAGLFERGLKKTFEAGKLKEAEKFQQRWKEGRENLEQFLALAAAFPQTNYTVLPKRNLRDDLWKARVILGDEAAAMAEITVQNAAEREKFSLLRVLLYPKIQPNYTDLNLYRMSNFLADFPQSNTRARVEFEMADVALCGAERLVAEARRGGSPESVVEKRAVATRYLEVARDLFGRVVADEQSGIAKADVQESRIAMLRICYAARDWAGLADWAERLIAEAPPEGKVWLQAKLYGGAGLASQRKLTEAAQTMDEVLAIGFKGNPSYDGPLASAAKWRIHIAKATGDETTARRVAEQVQSSKCEDSVKRTFLRDIQPLGVLPAATSQQ